MRKLTLLISLVAAVAAGTGTASAAVTASDYSLSPKSYDAGSVPLGTTASITIVATNRGSQIIGFRMRGVTPQSAMHEFRQDIHDVPAALDDCYVNDPDFGLEFLTLSPGESCVLRYAFAPTGKTGARTAAAHVEVGTYDQAGERIIDGYAQPHARTRFAISMKGTAAGLPFRVFPRTVAFGSHTVGATDTEQATITNFSSQSLAFVPAVASPKNSPYTVQTSFADDECTTPQEGEVNAMVVAPGSACTVAIRFHPTSTGTKNAKIRLDEYVVGDLADPGFRVNVIGLRPATSGTFSLTGKAVPVKIGVNTVGSRHFPVDFGSVPVGTSAIGTAEIVNLGDSALDIAGGGIAAKSSPFSEIPFPGIEPDGSCWTVFPFTTMVSIVGPHGSCQMPYAFRPTTNGAKTGTGKIKVWVATDAGGSEPAPGSRPAVSTTVQLKGKGVGAGG